MSLRCIGDTVVEPRGQGTAVDKHKSPLRVRMVGYVDLGFGPAPRKLLIEASHHLSRDAFKGSELSFQISEDLFVPIVALIVDGHTGKLLIDRQEVEALDWDSGIRWRAVF